VLSLLAKRAIERHAKKTKVIDKGLIGKYENREIVRIVGVFVVVASTLVFAAPANADNGKLDPETCLALSGAEMNLIMASSPQAARSPADILEKPGPPDPVNQAIEHFVSTGGVQASDPNADQTEKSIRDWVKQVCP
jgi:hypothetical protein